MFAGNGARGPKSALTQDFAIWLPFSECVETQYALGNPVTKCSSGNMSVAARQIGPGGRATALAPLDLEFGASWKLGRDESVTSQLEQLSGLCVLCVELHAATSHQHLSNPSVVGCSQ